MISDKGGGEVSHFLIFSDKGEGGGGGGRIFVFICWGGGGGRGILLVDFHNHKI